jgi:hypothetical protein
MTFVRQLIVPAFLSVFLATPAAAQELAIDTGPICDTQKQTERLIALMGGGTEHAIQAVNAEEHNPTACAVATVAYLRGPELATVHGKDGTYRIFKVLVVGLPTPDGLLVMEPAAFFTIFKVKEREA